MAYELRRSINEMFHEPTAEERRAAEWNRVLAAEQARQRSSVELMAATREEPAEPNSNRDPLSLLLMTEDERRAVRRKLARSGERSRVARMVAQPDRVKEIFSLAQPWRGPLGGD
jgi:hypothetical protein